MAAVDLYWLPLGAGGWFVRLNGRVYEALAARLGRRRARVRDELGAGEMWNSNSAIAWTLARGGIDAASVRPPEGGRAPGWRAGVEVARRASGHGRPGGVVADRAWEDTLAMPDIETMKQQARATWAAGDFDAVVPFIWEAGTVAAEASGCGPGDRVLDVAAGSGNAAIQAARRGAEVVASDLTPELFEPGRHRAADNGVELEWVEADAEDLPFDAASFDIAISTFGIMFAPRQSVAAAELARVVRPGGRVALCSWRPTGFVGEMFATIASFMSPPPPPEGPPARWGTEEGAHALLDGAFEIRCEERTLFQRYDGPVDEMTDYFVERFGPMIMARRALEPEGRWEEFLAAYRELTRRWDEGADGAAALPAAYLLVTGVRRG